MSSPRQTGEDNLTQPYRSLAHNLQKSLYGSLRGTLKAQRCSRQIDSRHTTASSSLHSPQMI